MSANEYYLLKKKKKGEKRATRLNDREKGKKKKKNENERERRKKKESLNWYSLPFFCVDVCVCVTLKKQEITLI
jgi:hypothetical protein